jgi:diguanylate cyclase (GGDEF)-like protein
MPHTILIVEDDDAFKDSVKQFLTRRSYQVEVASSAEDALEKMETCPVDVVLTDILLQGMDGLALTRLIKEKYDMEVIVMTGYHADYSYEEAVKTGASDFIFKPFRFEELGLRIKRVLREATLKRERNRLLKEMGQLAITDSLTGLYNSRHFFRQIEQEIERNARYRHHLSLLLLDIDHFKQYNDTWGHLEGDKVLMAIGRIINSCMRAMDTAYRYGGDEFAVLLPETDLQPAGMVGHRIKSLIGQTVFEPEPGVHESITISIGAAEFRSEEDISSFIHRSDQALYRSKENGRNRLTYDT